MIFLFVTACLILSGLCSAINRAIERDQQRKALAERKRIMAERERAKAERERELAAKAEAKRTEADRKEQFKQYKAEQMRDSILYSIEQNQELYRSIEKAMEGEISESKRISYQRQLMTIDNRIYQLNNKLMDLEFILSDY